MTADTVERLLARAIATLNTDEFEVALDWWLGQVEHIDNIIMLAFFDDRGPEVFFSRARETRVFERLASDYLLGVYLLDPVNGLHTGRVDQGLYRLRDIAPDQFQRNEYYATYYRRTTLIDELIYFVRPRPGVSVTICIGRDASSGRKFSASAIERMRKISPIVTALANQHWSSLHSEAEKDDRHVIQRMRDQLEQEQGISLSPRQSEIAFLILQGHSSVSIGLTLGISPQTVKVIRKQLYKKCNISSQAELFSLLTPYLLKT